MEPHNQNNINHHKILTIIVGLFIFMLAVWATIVVFDKYTGSSSEIVTGQLSGEGVALDNIPQGTLFFSGIANNGSNQVPNIFSLNILTDEIAQITGEDDFRSLHMSYYESSLHDNEVFMMLPNGVINGVSKMEPFMIFPDPSPTADAGALIVRNFDVPAGLFSHSFSISPQENNFSFATYLDYDSEYSIDNPQAWTTIVETGTSENRTTLTIPEATNPVWFDEDHLFFIRQDGIYVNNVTEATSYQLFTPDELVYLDFTSADKMTFVRNEQAIYMIVNKSDQNELLTILLDTQLLPNLSAGHTITDRFQYTNSDVGTYHPLALGEDHVAVVVVHKTMTSADTLVIYQLNAGQLAEVHRRTMSEFLPDSVILNYWRNGHQASALHPHSHSAEDVNNN